MSTFDCQRWVELVDRVAVGEHLSAAEVRFEQQHRKACPQCAEEARIWSALSGVLEEENLSEASRSAVSESDVSHLFSPSRRWGVLVGALAAAAALVMLSGVIWRSFPTANNQRQASASVELRLVSGEVSVGGAIASAGATLSPSDRLVTKNGRACVAYSNGTSACLGEQSELSPAGQSINDRTLHLSRGEVMCNLDHQPEGTVFSVETTRGSVVAKGTAFAVAYLESSEVEIRLHRGVVEVRSVLGEVRELHAPATLVLGETMRKVSRSAGDWQRDEAALSLTHFWAEGALAPLDVSPKTEHTEVRLAGVKLGSAPVSMLVSRGQHDLLIEAEGYEAHRETIMIKGAGRVMMNPRLERVAIPETRTIPAAPSAFPDVRATSVVTQRGASSELLLRAQQLRQAGKFREAAATYQTLTQTFPTSPEARAAWLSLAELQLSQLSSPAQALDSFERYLSKKGALSQEAYYGKIRALRQLGRLSEARAEAQKFVLTYPGTVQAVSLKQWLSVPKVAD